LTTEDSDTCFFTIKNYQQPKGLSSRFFNENLEEEFEIMGPIGKGL